MNKQCKTCYYTDGKRPLCEFDREKDEAYIRIDNAAERCYYYAKREEE